MCIAPCFAGANVLEDAVRSMAFALCNGALHPLTFPYYLLKPRIWRIFARIKTKGYASRISRSNNIKNMLSFISASFLLKNKNAKPPCWQSRERIERTDDRECSGYLARLRPDDHLSCAQVQPGQALLPEYIFIVQRRIARVNIMRMHLTGF